MKKYLSHLLLAFAFIFVGCEGAQAPMGEPGEIALDSKLLGTWISMDEAGEQASLLTITNENDTEYILIYEEIGDEEEEKMNLRAFASSVDGIQFANISCLNCEEDEKDEWFFFAFEFESDDVLLARALDDDVYKMGLKYLTQPAQIRAYISSHQTDSSFFDDEVGRFERKTD